MNISNDTLKVLKNFATINPNIVVKPGQRLATIADAKNILASATIVEDFPQEFGIYDLNEFLSVYGLIDDASLDFKDNSVSIDNATSNINYYFSEPEILTSPEKEITMPDPEFQIDLSLETLNQLRKASAVLGHTELAIIGDNGTITASLFDSKDNTSNTYGCALDEGNACTNEFEFVVNMANLKLLEGDYSVSFSSKMISHWQNTDYDVNYFIALEKSSKYVV